MMAAARGLTWRRNEVIDLLEIWGQSNVQKALRESHRNREVFEEVAQKMAALGHQRSGDECRSKTKAMRQAYKKVLCHNNKSGNSPTTCAFFEELDNILKGDPSVKRRRTSQSLRRETRNTALQSEEMVTLNMVAVPTDEIASISENTCEGDPIQEEENASLDGEDPVEDVLEAPELSQTDTSFADPQDRVPRDQTTAPSTSSGRVYSNIRDPKDIPPGIPLSDLSPPSRLALREEKRRKISAMQKVGELMLRQSSREHRILMESSAREHHQLMNAFQSAKEDDKNANREMCDIFRETLLAIKEMSHGSPEKNAGILCCRCTNNRSHEDGNIGAERGTACHRGNRSSAKKLFQDCIGEPCGSELDDLEPLINESEEFLEHIDYIAGTPDNRPQPLIYKKGYCHAGGMHGKKSSDVMRFNRPQDITHDLRNHPAEINEQYDIQDNVSEKEDSPDIVGTHVWGDTQLENQWLREQFKPLLHNVPKTVTGIPKVNEKPCDEECTHKIRAVNVFPETKQTTHVKNINKPSNDSSQSLLRNITASLVPEYDSENSEDHSTNSTPQSIRYNLRETSYETGFQKIKQQNTPRQLRLRKIKPGSVLKPKTKSSHDKKTSLYREEKLEPRNAEINAGHSSPGSEELGRAKRICRPRVIFSPE